MHQGLTPKPHALPRRTLVGLGASWLMALAPAMAQGPVFLPTAVPAAIGVPANLSGTSLEGKTFDLAAQRGRVVMVVLWRTDCAICLSKMPELRANALGWRNKPFDLVTLSLDAQRADAQAYDSVRRLVAGAEGPLWSFWHGDVVWSAAWAARSRLPVTLVFDENGLLKARHEGRVPADLWDALADLLP
jgi:thiol-disulfide isomerase/thioredoxin